jgi:hypothetical protein
MQAGSTTPKVQEVGSVVEDFTLPCANGGPASLSGSLAGKRGAVVMFWSGICSHCVRYDGYMNGFAARHPEIPLITIASRIGEDATVVQKSIAERGLTFPIYIDAGAVIAKAWYTQQTPRAFLISPDRTILYRGAIDNFKFPDDPQYEPYLEPAIAALLAGKPQPRGETASFGCAIQSVYYILPKSL